MNITFKQPFSAETKRDGKLANVRYQDNKTYSAKSIYYGINTVDIAFANGDFLQGLAISYLAAIDRNSTVQEGFIPDEVSNSTSEGAIKTLEIWGDVENQIQNESISPPPIEEIVDSSKPEVSFDYSIGIDDEYIKDLPEQEYTLEKQQTPIRGVSVDTLILDETEVFEAKQAVEPEPVEEVKTPAKETKPKSAKKKVKG